MTIQDMPPSSEEELTPETPEQTDSLAEASVSPEEALPSPEEVASPEAETSSPEIETPQPPSRMRAFFRTALRWFIGLFFVFAVGYLTAFFTLYQPLANRYTRMNADAQQTSARIAALQSDLESAEAKAETLQERLDALAAERDALQDDLDAADLHFYTLRALADVQGARLALTQEDPDTTRVYLSKVPAYLQKMHSLAGADVQDALDDMQKRLTLALGELDKDPQIAATDLAILADWLRQFETTLP